MINSLTCYRESSVQFKVLPMRSVKPICAPPRLSEVSTTLPLKQFQCSSDWRWPSLVLSRKIVKRFLCLCRSPGDDSVMSLALCPQVVSQAPQNLRSSETQAARGGYFSRVYNYARSFPHVSSSVKQHWLPSRGRMSIKWKLSEPLVTQKDLHVSTILNPQGLPVSYLSNRSHTVISGIKRLAASQMHTPCSMIIDCV